ncbi:hypothetical protein L7F22_030741 [Adiantum nelumboides]|nr:hypothetical protein [Adiantum nelumboides]
MIDSPQCHPQTGPHFTYLSNGPSPLVLLEPREASMPPLVSDKDMLSANVLSSCLTKALTTDPSIKGVHKVMLPAQSVMAHVSAFKTRAIVLYFIGKLLPLHKIAGFLDQGFKKAVVDKVFYNGSGLYEVLFFSFEAQKAFQQASTIILCGQVVHVFPWQPIK